MKEKLLPLEKQATINLSLILSLRMLGLFMVMPIFTLYAEQLAGATPFLLGLAVGVYGLLQALLQIPFGALSDRYGRKLIICCGLCCFILGSLICANAFHINQMILGRALQGAGAIGSTILALLADLTREKQRSTVMAVAGITIGFSFMLAMIIGPVLASFIHMQGLFNGAAFFGLLAIILLYFKVPTAQIVRWNSYTESKWSNLSQLVIHPDLFKLNIGILILHAIFTANFVVLPIYLAQHFNVTAHEQWLFYVPTLLIAAISSLCCVNLAEKKMQVKTYFIGAIIALSLAQILFCFTNMQTFIFALLIFFTSFSLLEAFLPSLVTRIAPPKMRGSALGLYSSSQFLGIFIGGLLGGWLYGHYGFASVYFACILLSFFWLLITASLPAPQCVVNVIWQLPSSHPTSWEIIVSSLNHIPGIEEMTFIAEEGLIYLKIASETAQHPDFIRLESMINGTVTTASSH